MSLTPIAYAIVKDVQTALRAMSVAGGYYYGVASDAVKLDPETDVEDMTAPNGPRPCVLIETGALDHNFTNSRSGEANVTLPLTIHWFHDADRTSDDALLQTFFRGCADVEKALTQDITRGGRAVDTRITSCDLVPVSNSGICWAAIKVDIHGWRAYGAPSETA